MTVLFIAKAKGNNLKFSSFIYEQAESLGEAGVNVDFFKLKGHGIKSFLLQAKKLRSYVKQKNIDILHAHYGLSGWIAVLSFRRKPLIISFMGSDLLGEYINANQISFRSRLVIVLSYLVQFYSKAIIVKSENIQKHIIIKSKSYIIPNGVKIKKFKQIEFPNLNKFLGLKEELKYVLFLNNPKDLWKNYKLVKEAISLINDPRIELLTPYPISSDKIPFYLNASDVLVLTSFMEGSPNVIKEAMACNCPIVSTDVGDVKWVMGKTKGCFISTFNPNHLANLIKEAISFRETFGNTEGRKRIKSLGLDSEAVAEKIIRVYKKVLV